VPPRRTRSVADVGQVLEGYHVTVVPECFVYNGVRRPMEYVSDVAKFTTTRLFERPVGTSSTGLLESGTHPLKLAEVVGQLPSTEKVGGTRDGEVFDTEVNPENRSVLGGVPLGVGLVSAEANMQEVVAITGSERAFRDTPLIRVEVLPLVSIVGIGESKRTPDATLRGRERHRIVIEQRHSPGIVVHCGCGESRLAHILAFRPAFDTAGDSLGGLVRGENRMLTPERGVFTHAVDGEAVPETEAGRASRRPTGAAQSDRRITLRESEPEPLLVRSASGPLLFFRARNR